MLRRIVILCLVIFYVQSSFAQNIGDSLFSEAKIFIEKKEYTEAYDLATSAVKSYHNKEQWDSAQDVLQFITNFPYDSIITSKFENFIQQQISQIKTCHPIEGANFSTYLGAFHAKNGQYNSSLLEYESAAKELHALKDTQYLHLVYYRIGQLMQLGKSDAIQALNYAEQAERINAKKKNQTKKFEGRIHYLRGLAYKGLNWEKSIFHFEKTQKINGDPYGSLENEITKAMIELGRFEEAYASAKRASQLFKTNYLVDYGQYMIYEAIALNHLGKYEQSLSTFESAADIMMEDYPPSDPNFYKVYYYKAQVLSNSGNHDEALINCQKVYTSSMPNYKSVNPTDIPEISQKEPNLWVLNTLIEQGKILVEKFQKTKDVNYLNLALKTGSKSIKNIELNRQLMDNYDSRAQYNNFLFEAYENALLASAMLYTVEPSPENKDQVLSFLKASKATLLQDIKRGMEQKKDVPEDVSRQAQKIASSIAKLESQLLKQESSNLSNNAQDIKNQLFDKQIELKEFKAIHSQYYASSISNDDSLGNHEDVDNLPDGSIVVAYQMYNEEILALAFDKDSLYLEFIPRDIDFDQKLVQMSKTLSSWDQTLSQSSDSELNIKNDAQYISERLLSSLSHFQDQVDHITIMPDGRLHSIPFELLHNPKGEGQLIDAYDLSYAYLFSSLPNTKNAERQPSSFAGFAPKYFKQLEGGSNENVNWLALRSGLIDIPEARKITANLAKRYDGESWIGKNATKAQFMTNAQDYDLLHLGMHSLFNEHTNALSSLVFYGEEDNELYLKEVQSMNIPASLVVLSACNTGVGGNVTGEGPLSLARSFFYAGAESTLMSLWQVPDEQTSKIMNLFYTNLESGQNKSKALANAKREFLATASTLESHPAFWAGFILVGDIEPLNMQTHQPFLSPVINYSILVLVLILIVVLIKKKMGRSK